MYIVEITLNTEEVIKLHLKKDNTAQVTYVISSGDGYLPKLQMTSFNNTCLKEEWNLIKGLNLSTVTGINVYIDEELIYSLNEDLMNITYSLDIGSGYLVESLIFNFNN